MAQTQYPQTFYEPESGACQIVLVRHGQSAPFDPAEPFPLVGGQGDPPLSERGEWQAIQVGHRLADEPIGAIYATSLQRTVQTATPLAHQLGLAIEIEPDLREVHLGVGEGGRFRKMSAEDHPEVVAMRRTRDWGAIAEAESNAELRHRCVGAVERIAAKHPDQLVAVFCHGGVIASLLGVAADTHPFAFHGARNGSISHIVRSPTAWTVRCFNDASHVGPLTQDADPPT